MLATMCQSNTRKLEICFQEYPEFRMHFFEQSYVDRNVIHQYVMSLFYISITRSKLGTRSSIIPSIAFLSEYHIFR